MFINSIYRYILGFSLGKEDNNANSAQLDELSEELVNRVIPYLIGTTFQLNQYNNANFAIKKVLPNMKPIWEKLSDGEFILTGLSIKNTQKINN